MFLPSIDFHSTRRKATRRGPEPEPEPEPE
jgi:hypothetical protein